MSLLDLRHSRICLINEESGIPILNVYCKNCSRKAICLNLITEFMELD